MLQAYVSDDRHSKLTLQHWTTRPLGELVLATSKQVQAGQSVYTRRTLRAYDLVVLGISNRMIWKCPTSRLLDHYNEHVTDNHLDVGVGSGYFPSRCRFRSSTPRVALMDLNADALDFASSRIRRYHPETYQRDVLRPLEIDGDHFDSIAINYLIHCLPGTIRSKSVLFDHLAEIMNAGAVIFGSTLLQGGVKRGWAARRLMNFYNRKGIFTNTGDSLSDLEIALRARFCEVQFKVVGSAALFSGRIP